MFGWVLYHFLSKMATWVCDRPEIGGRKHATKEDPSFRFSNAIHTWGTCGCEACQIIPMPWKRDLIEECKFSAKTQIVCPLRLAIHIYSCVLSTFTLVASDSFLPSYHLLCLRWQALMGLCLYFSMATIGKYIITWTTKTDWHLHCEYLSLNFVQMLMKHREEVGSGFLFLRAVHQRTFFFF